MSRINFIKIYEYDVYFHLNFLHKISSYDEVRKQSVDDSYSDIHSVDYGDYYETIYALLSVRSPLFRHSFSEKLSNRLQELNEKQTETTTCEDSKQYIKL